MAASDYFKQLTTVTPQEAAASRLRSAATGQNIVMSDPVVDQTWARWSIASKRPSNYFDYFFAGEDIRVRVAEIPEGDKDFGDLPIIQLGFNIEQEKTPIYGFWSYTYDGMMRGTRIVTGGFSIATKYPNYMTEVLAKAAFNRANKTLIDHYPRNVTNDDANIDQYWGKHTDPVINSVGGQHMFSVHPPFSLIVIYNVETTAIPTGSEFTQYYVDYYDETQNALMTDHNQRIVESSPDFENRIIVDAVELKGCERNFIPNGQLCVETYSFIARDVLVPPKPTPPNPGVKRLAPLPSGQRVPYVL